jgi:hypothetical protein
MDINGRIYYPQCNYYQVVVLITHRVVSTLIHSLLSTVAPLSRASSMYILTTPPLLGSRFITYFVLF